MDMKSLLLLGFTVLVFIVCSKASEQCEECKVEYEKIGCFVDKSPKERALAEELLNERDKKSPAYNGHYIDWKKYDDSLRGLACRCATKAKAKGYKVFGLQFYGECWSGPGGENTYNKYGEADKKKCFQNIYNDNDRHCKKCRKQECVGGKLTNYVYRIKEAPETCRKALGMQGKTIPDSSITASSMWDANHSPSRARLGTVREGSKIGAWSAKRNDANQWIQVDFGRFVKVSRIATQGRQDANQWVKSYTVQYSVDGGHFKDYKGGQVLMANSDRNTIVGNNLEPAIIARYIRIRPKSWSAHVSLRFEIYGCTSGFEIPTSPKCGYALGLQSHVVSDSQIRASSEWNSGHRAANGRLHFHAGAGRTGAWSARANNAEQWFQVDFKKIAKITKIATQGRQDANQWVKSYTLSYSRDGVFWSTYTAEVFTGNSDRSTVVSHELKQVIYARYLRIHPRSWQGHISMRTEVYGCTSGFDVPAETCVSVLGMQTKTIPDSSISASSMWDANHSPSRARLGTVREGSKIGAWSAKRNDVNQWIQVDMGRFVKVSRIATQGRQDANQWVKSYTVQYSVDGGHFKDYKGGQVLMANSDRNTIVGNNLEPAIIARYIRIRPKSWSAHVSLRFEIYGCTSGFEIPTGPKCGYALGLQSHVVSDSQIRASSEWNSGHRAANGRLHFHAGAGRTGAWSARANNAEQWFQIDFKKIAKITKIATQGRQDANQWVKSYTLSYSRDGVFWSTYTAEVFTGNSDRSTVVSHELKQVIYARYLRIHPRSWQGHISMRAEVYGCTSGFDVPAETCVSVLGMQTKAIPDSNITASSMWDANHSPSRARLGTVREGSKIGAWSAKRNDANQWIQVDFGRFVKVSRIATQGRQDANQWVKSYTVQYSVDGGHFKDYKGGQVLMANSDRNTIVGNNLEPAIIARYIRIRPKSWSAHVSLRFEIYGCTSGFEIPTGPKCGYALGLQSHVVSDSQIRASSEWNSGHRAANGRLHFHAGAGRTGAWSARTNNAEQWFQIDFKKIAKITKIATQGRQDANQWVKSYTLSYSRDGVFWSTYTAEVFTGNSDRSTVVSHELKQVIYARYLRIHPRSWQGHISMRAEVYGCTSGFDVPAETCVSVLGMQTKAIPDSNITASSMWDANHSPSRARLGTVREGSKIGAWSAKRNDANQWIQVDFGRFVKVSRIATQGRQDANQWVKSYTVQYSVDGGHFKDYKGGQVLMANSDRNTIVGNNLEPAIIARYIRIRPKSWSAHVSLRFEIYGCTSGFEIPTGPKCGYALGLQSHVVSDSQIRASSEWNSGHRAANGRLHFHAGAGRTGAWSARANNAEQWFQIDFKKIAKITKIATQGRQDANQWVKSYTLSYSRDGVFWSTYTAEVFTGNSDRSTVVSHELKQVIYARYLRIHPRSWQGHISMRAEVYGCTSGFDVPAETCVSVLGMQTKAIPDSNITASSMWDANHSPSRARLGTVREGSKIGAWSAKRNDANQWIQVDFGRFVKVSRIATQGRQDANQWVKSYTVQYSVDGGHFKDYKGGQVLMANSDRNTIVGNNLEPAIIARYIRIRPKSWSAHVSLRFEIYGCTSGFEIPTGPKCGYALGLQSHVVSDSQIRASSEWNSGHRAANGRLHFHAGAGRTGAWSARTNNAEQWFQIDFKKIAKITKIATQGRQDANQWVKSYTLSYSRDGVFWSTYTAEVFTGNSDRSTVVSHELKQVIYARYLRIHPRSWQGHISMRAEVYGCTSGFDVPAETCVSVLGMQTKAIPDSNITASSMWDANHSPSRARLGTVREGSKIGAWSAKRNDANQWIQVDFGRFVKVSRIATQGRQDANQWVKSYTVQYSVDGGHFKDYKGGQVLMANSDRNTIVGNNLEPAIIARYIRIRPKSWSAHVSLRFEIYGCTSGFEIPTGPKCGYALGLQSHVVSDSQIRASSEWNSGHRAANGRLHFHAGAGRTGAWSARTNNAEQWFQVDFKKIAKITKIATQGRQDANQWVKSYTLSYSRDGVFWSTYTAEVFTGNSDRSTVVSHELKQVIYARYLRIHPRSWQGHISMRAEVYGCTSGFDVPAETCVSVLGMQTKAIPDSNITASSMWDANHSPSRARLGTVREGSKIGAWSAKRNDANQWIQVDFGRFVKVSRIATQGRQDANQWVKSYTVQYSVDGGHFKDYKGGQVLMANSDRNTIVGNNLEPAIIARYIRIRPKSWSAHVSLRFEIYGCTSGFEIPTGPKCGYALGLQSHVVSDSQIRASSEWNSGHRAANGRLHFHAGAGRTGAWSARTNNAEQWFQIDFKKIAKITKIATQGRQDANQWVKSYTLSYSRDGVFWSTYTTEVFTGNSDRSTVVSHELKQVIYARYLRIHPRSWQGHISMRAEVYGCTSGFDVPAETCVSVLGMQTKAIPDSNITASSMWDANHSPSRARLGTVREGSKIGAWSAKRNDANQWIQVDFGRFVKVSRIATQGRQDANQWVKSYTVQYSVDGGHFKDYKGGQVLMANSDRNTIVGNNLEPAIIARYIRIRPKSWSAHVSLRFEIYGCTSGFEIPTGPKCGYALGLQSHVVSDSQIRASSEWNSGHRAANGRLHFHAGAGRTGAWSARTNNAEQWFQIDFKKIAKITKIATQGRQDANQWVKSYTLSYSRDGVFWSTYTAEVFTGNSDRSTVVSHELKQVIYARYLRIHPRSWQGHISMRAEVYGCTSGFDVPAETCVSVLGMQTKTIPDSNITASSMWDANHSPSRARLGTVREGSKIGAWSAKRNDANQWIQVDFGRFVKVSRIATQGRQDANQWVKSYIVQYSVDGGHFEDYEGGQVLMGNNDRNTIVGNILEPAIIARYIRIRPKSWQSHISLRFEIYGCTSGFPIPSTPTCAGVINLDDWMLSSSSDWDYKHRAANGKLDFIGGGGRTGAWSARSNNANQWLLVDFGREMKVTRISTKGRHDANQWVKTYTAEYSEDGVRFTPYRVGGAVKTFAANTDRYSVVSHKLPTPIVAQYLRLRPKSWYGHISMRMGMYGCPTGKKPASPYCHQAMDIGVIMDRSGSIGAYNFRRAQDFVARLISHFEYASSGSRFGVIAYNTVAKTILRFSDAAVQNPKGVMRRVYGIRYLGGGTRTDRALQLANSDLYSSQGGYRSNVPNVLFVLTDGKTNRGSLPYSTVLRPLLGKKVKIIAVGVGRGIKDSELQQISNKHVFHVRDFKGLFEKLKDILDASCPGKQGSKVPTPPTPAGIINLEEWMLSSSSVWRYNHRAANGILDFLGGGGSAWSARSNDANQWLLVDFGREMKVTRISTKGRRDANQWVRTYTVEYSLDGIRFTLYKLGGVVKIFTANTDRYSIVSHELQTPIVAQYIRLRPKSWRGRISMCVGMYGFPTGKKPASPYCHQAMDIGVIMDRSGSIGARNFRRAQDFVARLISHFEYASSGSRFGVIAYNTVAKTILRFSDAAVQNPKGVMRRVYGIRYWRGGTRTDRALKLANSDLYSSRGGYRSNVPNVLFVLTDGKTNRGSLPYSTVLRPLLGKKVKIIAVGVGRGINDSELQQISNKHVFHVRDFKGLFEKLKDILDASCPGKQG